MKVALSAIGKFHTFDLARELHRQGVLAGIYTGYPRFKLRQEALPDALIHTFPWVHGAYMAFPWKHRLSANMIQQWERLNTGSFSRFVQHQLPDCDVYVGLSGSGLLAGQSAQRRGARYVCDRGSAHIRVQDRLLREEHQQWGLPYAGIDPAVIDREEQEYEQADCITVPSAFVMRSFIERGVPQHKLRLLPYGVNLSRFQPVATPAPDRFDVLFVGALSLQKGVTYLLQAFARIQHPAKTLTFAGSAPPSIINWLQQHQLWPEQARCLGHVAQGTLQEHMSKSHVMVLPSIQEGFGMVMAQAMACGCPVIASQHTGAEDLFQDGEEGYIVPARDVDALTQRLQQLADEPTLRQQMGAKALHRVQSIGGWRNYGENALAIYRTLLTP